MTFCLQHLPYCLVPDIIHQDISLKPHRCQQDGRSSAKINRNLGTMGLCVGTINMLTRFPPRNINLMVAFKSKSVRFII